MRNIFDQYRFPENRLTHALACCLNEDRKLLRGFAVWITTKQCPSRAALEVVEQHVPGQTVVDWDENERTGLPDLWIYDNHNYNWSVVVECKVASPVETDQLHRHVRTAQRNGFDDITLVVISADKPSRLLPDYVYKTWTEVFRWMDQHGRKSEWARRFVAYIQIAEERMASENYLGDKTLTEFDGIPFCKETPYTYRAAKRSLKLLMAELRKRNDLRRLGMAPQGAGRPAITDNEFGVWDFIPLSSAPEHGSFTTYPHLTVTIGKHRLLAIVILPHGVKARFRRNLTDLGIDGMRGLVAEVEEGVIRAVKPIDGAFPWMQAVQRHYPSQRANPIEDATMEFDLRTTVPGPKSKVKHQPEWLEAAFNALADKGSTNLQLAIGAVFPYGSPALQSRSIVDPIANVWMACRPWLQQILQGPHS